MSRAARRHRLILLTLKVKDITLDRTSHIFHLYTLSCRIGKVVASRDAVARSIPAEVALIYTMHEELRGYCP